jgi:hypothetical protein
MGFEHKDVHLGVEFFSDGWVFPIVDFNISSANLASNFKLECQRFSLLEISRFINHAHDRLE